MSSSVRTKDRQSKLVGSKVDGPPPLALMVASAAEAPGEYNTWGGLGLTVGPVPSLGVLTTPALTVVWDSSWLPLQRAEAVIADAIERCSLFVE